MNLKISKEKLESTVVSDLSRRLNSQRRIDLSLAVELLMTFRSLSDSREDLKTTTLTLYLVVKVHKKKSLKIQNV